VTTYELTFQFHEAFGHPAETEPTVPSEKQRLLRAKLIASELTELCDAMGVEILVQRAPGSHDYTIRAALTGQPVDMVGVADGLGDLDVVVNGGFCIFGLDGPGIAEEIYNSNMTKLGPGGKPIIAQDGKIVKGPYFVEPDLTRFVGVVPYGNDSGQG
jgi:predicted HAD superfamily Cof-like phosphohydrolase